MREPTRGSELFDRAGVCWTFEREIGLWMDYRWATGVVLAAAVTCLAGSGTTPAARTLAGQNLGPELAPLEVQVSRNPRDLEALETLVEAYLERQAPGLAGAALDRAPLELKQRARIADARARVLTELGLPGPALAAEERVFEACEVEACSTALLARAERRARWLRELVRLGVEDSLDDPERALLAYRLAVREVRLAD